jgi:hypothetical protein
LGRLKAILGQGNDPGKRIAFGRKLRQTGASKGYDAAAADAARAGCARPHALFHKTETHRRIYPRRALLSMPPGT